jgi:Holliday junction resolvase
MESKLQSKIIKDLEKRGCLAYKQTASINGVPDICACSPDGRYIAIEVKDKGKKPTLLQEYVIETIARLNGIAFWCDNWETYKERINESLKA